MRYVTNSHWFECPLSLHLEPSCCINLCICHLSHPHSGPTWFLPFSCLFRLADSLHWFLRTCTTINSECRICEKALILTRIWKHIYSFWSFVWGINPLSLSLLQYMTLSLEKHVLCVHFHWYCYWIWAWTMKYYKMCKALCFPANRGTYKSSAGLFLHYKI